MRISIVWKLLIPIVIMVSLLASSLLWVQLRLLNEAFHRRMYAEIALAADVAGTQEGNLGQRMLDLARELATRPSVARALIAHDRRAAHDDLSAAAADLGVSGIALFDPRGSFLAATWPAPGATGVPSQITSLVATALTGTTVGGPIPSWQSPGEVAIVAVVPVRAATRVVGAVVAEAVMGNPFVDDVKRLTGLDVGVFLGNRRVATTLFDKNGQRILNSQAASTQTDLVLTHGETITDEVTFVGKRWIARYFPLRSPAGPIIGMFAMGGSFDQIAGDRGDIIRTALGASLLALALACAATIALGYRILSPVRHLRAAAQAVRRGEPEKADFAITTGDEVQDLGATMMEMVGTLQAREHALTEANARLLDASRHKSEFLSRMSHELRTPLNAIIGFSDLLLERIAGDVTAKQEEFLQDIRNSGAHLLTLINDILDISKIEAGRMDLHFEETDLTLVVADALTTLRPLSQQKHLDVSSVLDPGAAVIRADKVRLRQIVFNLLSNAAKFTPEGGQIRVEVRRINDEAELTVVDTGPGIASGDQEKLFQQFSQLQEGQQSGHAGTGLGLALVKRLVELHGGRVWVESEVGKGSRFIVRLPLGASTAPASAGTGPVLVVEDDPAVRKLFTNYLSAAGYTTDVISDGQGVVDKAKAVRPVAICLDIRLPGVEDWEVLRRLKEDPATAPIPIVVTTILEDAERAFSLGAVGALRKPVRREDLLDAVAKAMRTVPQVTPIILVVDDDPSVLQALPPMLDHAGYRTLTASGGREGITQAQQHLPHLIVLDIMMPDVNGFEVIVALRGDVRTRGIPVLVLTAKDLTENERAFLDQRVQSIRAKGSMLPQALVEEVKRVLAAPQADGG